MSDFELVAPPDDVKPVGARVSTQKLYEQWVQLSEIHGHGHLWLADRLAYVVLKLEAKRD